ncbi:MAG: hypothetical protein JW955_14805 [Sedimentisphaerales bacterium]|nr:hypothetical protein [Sedimentisphaerales bacterium]
MATPDLDKQSNLATVVGIILSGLAMSVGWGFRGDYGHEAGAMVPGALLGLAICLSSGRADWWRRAAIMGMGGAIGWAFGGQMSYGKIVGYTAGSSLLDVSYGYACLFLIGGLWAGVGSAILAMSVTQPRSYLEQFARPLVMLGLAWFVLSMTGATDRLVGRWSLNDTDWVGALSAVAVSGVCAVVFARDRSACALIAILAAGWWAGYLVLAGLLGLHMTPPRSDNWAGSVGLFATLLAYLLRRRDRTAVMLAGWGVLIGGIGFALGDFANMLGRAQWGPIGRYEVLHGLDYWKWMEQGFGLIMGLGVGTVFLRNVRADLAAPREDSQGKRLAVVSLLFLLIVMMWLNLSKNISNWANGKHIPPGVLGADSALWFLLIGALLAGVMVVAIVQHRRGRLPLAPASDFGRTQILFLLILWIAVIGAFTQALPGLSGRGVFLVQASFLITAGVCSLIVVSLRGQAQPQLAEPRQPSEASWRLGWTFWACLCLVPLLLFVTAYLTVASHDGPLPHSQVRFSPPPAAESTPARP